MGFNTRVVLGIIVFGVRVLVVGVWVYLYIQEEVGGEDVLWSVRHHQISFLSVHLSTFF